MVLQLKIQVFVVKNMTVYHFLITNIKKKIEKTILALLHKTSTQISLGPHRFLKIHFYDGNVL